MDGRGNHAINDLKTCEKSIKIFLFKEYCDYEIFLKTQ